MKEKDGPLSRNVLYSFQPFHGDACGLFLALFGKAKNKDQGLMGPLIPIWSQWTVFLGFLCTCFFSFYPPMSMLFLQRQNTIVRSPLLQPYP
jgi:hypothetical protein